ncbi:MAG: toll/interleukin-1 receptor domain-containing protein, partial [Myxococcales bacterium]|nr:toll/interleukin-1 receptor domain-containing protein [Myxococcales bacterium]
MNARTSSSDRRLDVVLTYARNTLALARAIHKFLKSAGLQVWFDEVSPRTGDHWLASHYRALTRARHHLILLTERTPPMWQKSVFDFASRCAALNRSLETVPLLREGFEPGPLAETLARYQVAHLAHDKDERDAQLRDLVARLREQSVRASVPPSDAVVPYSGLRAYEVDEAGVFFGRDLEVSEAVARLGTQPDGRHRRWLRIIGPSGVGKASFARAGLTSAVLRGGIQGAPLAWRMATVRLGDEPIEQLSVELATVFPGLGARDVANTLRTAGLADLVHDLLPADQGLLLVIDHLEDVHGHRVAPEVRTRIDRLLSEALEDFDQRLFLVTTERGDVSDDIDGRLPRLTGLLGSHGAVQTLAEPTREGLKAIIDGPAALRGRPWPPVLARQLLDDAERHRGGPGALSWMLATLMHADRATIQGYEGLGGLATGVGKAYDARLAAMSEDDQTRTRSLLTALVDGGRGRGDRPRALSFEEAVAGAGEGPRSEALVERLETGLGAEGCFAPPF